MRYLFTWDCLTSLEALLPCFDHTASLFSMSTSGFYERFHDSTNGMDAGDNPQSVFVYDSMMLAFMAILHSDKVE